MSVCGILQVAQENRTYEEKKNNNRVECWVVFCQTASQQVKIVT